MEQASSYPLPESTSGFSTQQRQALHEPALSLKDRAVGLVDFDLQVDNSLKKKITTEKRKDCFTSSFLNYVSGFCS